MFDVVLFEEILLLCHFVKFSTLSCGLDAFADLANELKAETIIHESTDNSSYSSMLRGFFFKLNKEVLSAGMVFSPPYIGLKAPGFVLDSVFLCKCKYISDDLALFNDETYFSLKIFLSQ